MVSPDGGGAPAATLESFFFYASGIETAKPRDIDLSNPLYPSVRPSSLFFLQKNFCRNLSEIANKRWRAND